jgi:hypothetical protein
MPERVWHRALERAGLVILRYRFYHKAALKASHLERGLNDRFVPAGYFRPGTLSALYLGLLLFSVFDQIRLLAFHRFDLGLLQGITKVKRGAHF